MAKPTLEDAIALAVKVHRGQVDKGDQPYILHPLRVMFRLETDEERIVAVLHDVVEDSDTTLKDLREMGYSKKIVEAIDHLTRREDESYDEFVERAAANPLARRVKLADLEDNMDIKRYPSLNDTILKKLPQYHRAWQKVKDME
jgi:(p)ppGpp synthase/HD superfamily hydrolase